jgi:hypothetical protein
MPAFRIVYTRPSSDRPETLTAGFDTLDQAMDVFAARGLSILYIAEQTRDAKCLGSLVGEVARKGETEAPLRSSFPLRRFSARALA